MHQGLDNPLWLMHARSGERQAEQLSSIILSRALQCHFSVTVAHRQSLAILQKKILLKLTNQARAILQIAPQGSKYTVAYIFKTLINPYGIKGIFQHTPDYLLIH